MAYKFEKSREWKYRRQCGHYTKTFQVINERKLIVKKQKRIYVKETTGNSRLLNSQISKRELTFDKERDFHAKHRDEFPNKQKQFAKGKKSPLSLSFVASN